MAGGGEHGKRSVLVWRTGWLPASETFIRNQVAAFRRWRARPTGVWRIDSSLTDSGDAVLFESELPIPRAVSAVVLNVLATHAIGRMLREQPEIELVHVHFLSELGHVLRAVRRANLPVIVTAHGFDATSWPGREGAPAWVRPPLQWYRQRQLRRALDRVDAIVAVSEFIRQRLLELGAAEDKIVVRHIGIPVDGEVPPGGPRSGVIFVGRLVAKKGVEDLIRAWHQLGDAVEGVPLTVIGDGPQLPSLRALAKDLGVPATFAGTRTSSEVTGALREHAIFCGPSRTGPDGDSEGLGMVFLEAAREELPVVAYRHGGVPEAVDHGVTGLLAEEGDVPGLAAHLGTLLSDADLRRRMGAAGRARVIEEFDLDRCTEKLEQLYDSIARGGPTGRRSRA